MTEERFLPPDDEISLRDLYLIVKGGLPLIILVALLSAAAAVSFVTLRGPDYSAEATVVVNPTPLRSSPTSSISIDQQNQVSFETYERLAFGADVLSQAIESLDASTLTIADLEAAGSLERIGDSSDSDASPLTVAHQVTLPDPSEAARVADAWAGATIVALRETIGASIESLSAGTEEQLANLGARLADLEEQWRAFQQRDDSALLESQLAGISQRLPLTEAYREELARLLADARSARQALSADTSGAEDGELELNRRVELQRLTARTAGLEAQLLETDRQLEEMRQQAELLRTRQAQLVIERDRLQAQLDTYQTTYAELSAIQPLIDYSQQLLTGNIRILSNASLPIDPVGISRGLLALIAALVGGLLALLFVFLRAAVSPEPPPTASRLEPRAPEAEPTASQPEPTAPEPPVTVRTPR